MPNSLKRFFKLSALFCLILGLSACAELGLTVPAVAVSGAVSGGAAGISYSITNVAYKTVSYPVADVRAALSKALRKMDIQETKTERGKDTVRILASTEKLHIFIDLEEVTPTVTKIEVNAKRGIFVKDQPTATEIIVQIEKNLETKQ